MYCTMPGNDSYLILSLILVVQANSIYVKFDCIAHFCLSLRLANQKADIIRELLLNLIII